tara:strand:- start:21762 stop:22649 length:888 start_codon:yes stop_codon:yes gene_type:complete
MNRVLTIIIPAYNEESSLKSYLPKVISFADSNNFNLTIVDDGSKDASFKICKNLLDKNNSAHKLIRHKVNKGYGGAIKTGIKEATTKYVITIDADGQHNLEDINFLCSEIISSDSDMIVGSRKGLRDANLFRRIGKRIIRFIANFLVPLNIYDVNSGMKIYNTKLAKNYIKLCPNGMAYSDTILLVFVYFRHLVTERPISINERISGTSTINILTAIKTIKEIFNMVILFNPLKVFAIPAIFIIVLSIMWGFPILIKGKGISTGTMLGIMTGSLLLVLGFLAEQISHIRRNQISE